MGTLRTAYFNWLIAQQHLDSKFIVRIDDTDLKRSQDDLIQLIFDTLKHYGLYWDRTFKQSDDFGKYRTFANHFLHNNMTKKDGDAIRIDLHGIELPDWNDTIAGKMSGDVKPDLYTSIVNQVIIKSDGTPTYIFASAIDDIVSGVTWVVTLFTEDGYRKSKKYDISGYKYIRPVQQKKLEIKIIVNGKEIDPKDFSKESWDNLRK